MTELTTAAAAADERGVSPRRMRELIAEAGIAVAGREGGRGANLYPAGVVRAIPGPLRGTRNDLLGERIGRLFGTARRIAEARGARDEWDKHFEQLLDGNPLAVQGVGAASRRWTKRRPVPVAVVEDLAEVERLATEVGELPEVLPMSLRSRIIRADAATRTGTPSVVRRERPASPTGP